MPNEQNNQNNQTQKEVVDIFAGLDPSPERLKKEIPKMSAPVAEISNSYVPPLPPPAPGRSKFFIVGVILAIILAAIVIGLIVLKLVFGIDFGTIEIGGKSEAPAVVEKVEAPVVESAPTTVVEPEPAPTPAIVELPKEDSDLDGLTDAEETNLGTNLLKIDSDNDKLFDYDEVKTYGTDPLNPDTDGDSYLDGEEVLSQYNPKGPGKLLNFEKAKEQAQ